MVLYIYLDRSIFLIWLIFRTPPNLILLILKIRIDAILFHLNDRYIFKNLEDNIKNEIRKVFQSFKD